MKILKISFIALLIVSSFAACKKDKVAVVPVTIEGKWTGTFLNTKTDPAATTALVFNLHSPGGGLDRLDPNDGTTIVSNGGWELIDKAFTAQYYDTIDKKTYYFKATFNSTAGKLVSGTWGFSADVTDQGTWTMTKNK